MFMIILEETALGLERSFTTQVHHKETFRVRRVGAGSVVKGLTAALSQSCSYPTWTISQHSQRPPTSCIKMPELYLIPVRHGATSLLRSKQHINIIDTHSTQFIDSWAFSTPQTTKKYLSTTHTRRSQPKMH